MSPLAVALQKKRDRFVKQQHCRFDSESDYRWGGYEANECSDCCLDAYAETYELKPDSKTECVANCFQFDEDAPPPVYETYYYDVCHCR